jgi:hypothetical protein
MPFILAGTLAGRLAGRLMDHGITNKVREGFEKRSPAGNVGVSAAGHDRFRTKAKD